MDDYISYKNIQAENTKRFKAYSKEEQAELRELGYNNRGSDNIMQSSYILDKYEEEEKGFIGIIEEVWDDEDEKVTESYDYEPGINYVDIPSGWQWFRQFLVELLNLLTTHPQRRGFPRRVH